MIKMLRNMTLKKFSRKISVAPMLDWTDRHERYFLRLISKHCLLYTEMVTTGALLHGDQARHLDFNPKEQPLALQLGGSDPIELAKCAQLAEKWGYSEINLNVGCPSDRVQSGKFGACLMAEPELVRDCLKSMNDVVSIPVTVKTRIGIDRSDSFDVLHHFVETVKQSGCKVFIIHARKAWLDGLSPKENRHIPPLCYENVYQIKQHFPDLEIIINGGITSLEQCDEHLEHVDGVMIGREAYQNPYILATVDSQYYSDISKSHHLSPARLSVQPPTRLEILEQLYPYIESHLSSGGKLNHISRHILGLYQSQPGAKYFRRILSQQAHQVDAGISVIHQALDSMQEQVDRIQTRLAKMTKDS